MRGKLLKQILIAIFLLGGSLFFIDIAKIYVNFTVDQFKLSLFYWITSLSTILFEDLTTAFILLAPVSLLSLISELINKKIFSYLISFCNKLYFFLVSTNLIYLLALVLISPSFNFNVEQISLGLEKLKLNQKLLMLGIPLLYLLASLLIFKAKKKIEKRKVLRVLGLVSILLFSFYETYKPNFSKDKLCSIKELLYRVKDDNKTSLVKKEVDYREAFKNYLGLESIYEKEKNFTKLLIRKTSPKDKELSVALIYVEDLSKSDLINKIGVNLYTFNNVLGNNSNIERSIQQLKVNLPVWGEDSNKNEEYLKSFATYYCHPFEEHLCKYSNEIGSLKGDDKLRFDFIKLKKLSLKNYSYINKIINLEKDKKIFVFTTNTKSKTSNTYADNLSFISFYIPKEYKPSYFDASKIIGQEDLMPSIYNLALSEKSYLSLGDDIFSDAHSDGVNESIYSTHSGFLYENSYFSLDGKTKNSKEERSLLERRYKSIKDISEFIIKQSEL